MAHIGISEAHLFQATDNNSTIAFQPSTQLFFGLDELHKAILDNDQGQSVEDVGAGLEDCYGCVEVLSAIDELARAGLISKTELPHDAPMDAPLCEGNVEIEERLHISLHISNACNMRCAYCFVHSKGHWEKQGMMTSEVARQAVRWALETAKPIGRCQIDFFGGEPLLNFGLIQEIVPYARQCALEAGTDISFGLATNGTLMPDEVIRFLKDERIEIQISLDGGPCDQNSLRRFADGSNTYDVIAENVRKLVARAPEQATLRATMTSNNLDRKAIAEHLKRFGARSVKVAPVVALPNAPYALREEHVPELKLRLRELSQYELEAVYEGEEHAGFFGRYIKDLLMRIKKCHGCEGGKTSLAVAFDGSLYFCSSLIDVPGFQLGDVFSGIDPAAQERLNNMFHIENRVLCQTCWARYLCGGGCVYDAYTANGDPLQPNPVSCEQIRHTYELAMEMCLEIQERDEELLNQLYDLKEVEVEENEIPNRDRMD